MRIVSKNELGQIIKRHPNGGVVFAVYRDIGIGQSYTDTLHISDGISAISGDPFGATTIQFDDDNELFDYDWALWEEDDTELFAVFTKSELQLIIDKLTEAQKECEEV